jgi:hypothetical protein
MVLPSQFVRAIQYSVSPSLMLTDAPLQKNSLSLAFCLLMKLNANTDAIVTVAVMSTVFAVR